MLQGIGIGILACPHKVRYYMEFIVKLRKITEPANELLLVHYPPLFLLSEFMSMTNRIERRYSGPLREPRLPSVCMKVYLIL